MTLRELKLRWLARWFGKVVQRQRYEARFRTAQRCGR
jgi:hypothetical protein